MIKRGIINRINPPACENPTWCPQCSFAWHCHERRVGERVRIFWPGVTLAVVLVLGAFSQLI